MAPLIISILFRLWFATGPCAIPQDVVIAHVAEAGGESYVSGDREIFVPTDEAPRFYGSFGSPYLDPDNGRLQQIDHAIQQNDPAFMESLLIRPASCDLPTSKRQRG